MEAASRMTVDRGWAGRETWLPTFAITARHVTPILGKRDTRGNAVFPLRSANSSGKCSVFFVAFWPTEVLLSQGTKVWTRFCKTSRPPSTGRIDGDSTRDGPNSGLTVEEVYLVGSQDRCAELLQKAKWIRFSGVE